MRDVDRAAELAHDEWAEEERLGDIVERLERVEGNQRNHEQQIGRIEELLACLVLFGPQEWRGDTFDRARDKFMEGRG